MKQSIEEILPIIKYRMEAIETGRLALAYAKNWETIPSLEIYLDGKLVIEGTATAFTNNAIETGVMHCRALLEFLGLSGNGQTKLKEITKPRKSKDMAIEDFSSLKKVTLLKAVSSYRGSHADAEAALAYTIHLANKVMAHITSSLQEHERGNEFLEIAFRGVPLLMINNFYDPLGISVPKYELQSRNHEIN